MQQGLLRGLRWRLCLARVPKPVAGWRGKRRKSTSRHLRFETDVHRVQSGRGEFARLVIPFAQPVRRLELHQVHHVDHADSVTLVADKIFFIFPISLWIPVGSTTRVNLIQQIARLKTYSTMGVIRTRNSERQRNLYSDQNSYFTPFMPR
jgi:hypothetical protein